MLENTLESPLDCKENQSVHPKGDQSWMLFLGLIFEAETPIFWLPDAKSWLIWKDPDAGKDWGHEGEWDDGGWDGWMASPSRWAWFWVNSGSWWWTGRPGMLQSMGSQRVGHDWVNELNWTELKGKGVKERYTQLNIEFQRIARRDKEILPQWSMQRDRGKQ